MRLQGACVCVVAYNWVATNACPPLWSEGRVSEQTVCNDTNPFVRISNDGVKSFRCLCQRHTRYLYFESLDWGRAGHWLTPDADGYLPLNVSTWRSQCVINHFLIISSRTCIVSTTPTWSKLSISDWPAVRLLRPRSALWFVIWTAYL